MQTKNQVSLPRKTLNVIMLLGLFFSTFSAGNLSSVHAQGVTKTVTSVPIIINANLILERLIIYYQVPADSGAFIQPINETESTVLGLFVIPATIDSGPVLHYFVAIQNGDDLTIDTEYTVQFIEDLEILHANGVISKDFLNIFNQISAQGDGSSQLSLPWTSNSDATFTNGPHGDGFQPAPTVLSAIDLVPNDRQVRAAREGFAQQIICSGKTQSSWIIVNHSDGWRTSYYHVINAQVSTSGRGVSRGEYLGDLATTSADALRCGGGWTGAHVHMALLRNGTQVSVVGLDIGGWTVGGSGGNGTMTRISDGAVRYASTANGNRIINNNGAIGSGGGGGGSACPGPSLSNPSNDYISTSQSINFSWSALSGCTFNGYTFRIKDISNMDSGGNTIVDTGEGNTSRTETIASQWNNRDLYWGVKAANAPNGASWTVRRFRIQPGSAPSTPSNPSPSDYSTLSRTNNTNLTWNTNGSSCTVHIWGGSIDISPSGGCSSLALGAQRGGAYSWQVNASNSYGNSTGPTWHFNVKPYGPSGLSSSVASSSQINLSWTLSSDDDGTNVDGYDIYKNGQLVGSVNKGVNTYQATGLACNTGYSFYVLSKRQNVQSDASNTVTSTTSACGPASPTLNSPANNATLARTTSIVLSWNTASGASQYRAHFWGGPNIDVWSSWTSGTSATLGSQWGGAYQWSVEASNGSVSSYSETRNLTVLYGTPPNLSATAISPTQINLAWNASADAPGNVDGYRIYRNGSEVTTVGSSTTTYQDTGLTCGTAYSYTVRAFKGALESSASNTASASATNCPPVMPGNLTVSGETTSSLTLNWQDNSNNETGFKIYRWGYDGAQWTFIYLTTVGVNVTTYTQTGLACGSGFNYYEVSAYNANGESTHAGWVQGTTVACPKSELSIASITFDPVSPFTNDDVWAEVVIQNTSNVPAVGFWTDFYVDDTPTGCADWGGYYGWSDSLAANATFTWWVRIPANSLTAGTHQFRAYIDSGCEITETNEDNNISSAAFTLTAPSSAAPAHDDFNSARLVSSIPYSNTVDVSGATTASDDPYVPDCAGFELTPGMTSVWYKYIPTANQSLYLDTFGSSYDTYIAVWSGPRSNLSSIACNDDASGHGLQSGLPVNLTAGTTYYFEIAQYSDSTSISSLSVASTTRTDLRSSSAATLATKSSPNFKPTSDLEAQAGGTLQFHVISIASFDSPWVGSVSITSDKNVVAVGRPHIGAEVASYNGFSSGALTAYIPMLFKNAFGGSYNSAFYIQNVHASNTANITIKYYDSAGTLNCTVTDTVAALASKGYWVPSETCLPASWVGGVVVTSDQPIVANGRPHIGAEVMTYDSFSTGSLTSYIPMLFKGAFGGSYNSAFYVQNVHATNTANITIKYYDSAGSLKCTVGDTVAPLASKGYWVPGESCLPAGWVGGVVVTSNQPIVTVGRPHIGTQITTYNGFTSGSMNSYVPMLFKGAFGGSYNAAFYVQNVHASNTANITIKYYDSAGNLSCTVTDTVSALASKGYWVPGESCLPAGWVGGVVVTSDQPIVAVGRPHIGDQVTTYNGFTSGGLSSYLPMLFKEAFGGSYNSAFYVQNTEASAAAVTIKFYNSSGALTCTRSDSIPALSTLGYWVPSVTCSP